MMIAKKMSYWKDFKTLIIGWHLEKPSNQKQLKSLLIQLLNLYNNKWISLEYNKRIYWTKAMINQTDFIILQLKRSKRNMVIMKQESQMPFPRKLNPLQNQNLHSIFKWRFTTNQKNHMSNHIRMRTKEYMVIKTEVWRHLITKIETKELLQRVQTCLIYLQIDWANTIILSQNHLDKTIMKTTNKANILRNQEK